MGPAEVCNEFTDRKVKYSIWKRKAHGGPELQSYIPTLNKAFALACF